MTASLRLRTPLALAALYITTLACSSQATSAPKPTTVTPPPDSPTTIPTNAPIPATGTPPSLTIPTPELTLLLRVAYVTEDDTLNIRSAPGIENDVIDTLAYNATDLIQTGPAATASDGGLWIPIHTGTTQGWTNRYYLTEHIPPAHFCNKPAPHALIAQLTEAIATHNSTQLAQLIHPQRGLLLRMAAWNTEIHLSPDEVALFFEDPTVRNWGNHFGSGLPMEGTAAEIVLPILEADFLADSIEQHCNQFPDVTFYGLPPEYRAVNFYTIHRPPPDLEENVFNWGTWAAGIEYWDGLPHLSFLIHYQWEP